MYDSAWAFEAVADNNIKTVQYIQLGSCYYE